MVKRLPAIWETRVQSLCQEDPLEKEMATHSSILAWKIHPMDRGAWWATVHGVALSQTRLNGGAHTHGGRVSVEYFAVTRFANITRF